MLAQSYMATGRTQLAQTVLDRLIDAAATNETALDHAVQLRTRLLVQSGRRLDEAETALREQYEKQPDNPTVAMDLATALAGQDKLEEAESLLNAHAGKNPDDPAGWYMLGQFYLDRNDPELVGKASSALTRALMIDPNHVPSLRGQIEAQSRQGKAVETIQLADRYLEMRPEDDFVLFRKAAVLYQMNRMDEASTAVNRALDVNDRPDYRYLRANIHIAQEHFEDALADLQSITTDTSRTANYDMALAEAYWGVGNHESALQYFESAKRKSQPQDAVSPDRIRRFEAQITENPAA
jgi:predicted Zn-dependent protease